MAAHELEMQMQIMSVPPPGAQNQTPGVLNTPVGNMQMMPPPGLSMMPPPNSAQTQSMLPQSSTLQPPPGLQSVLQPNWPEELSAIDGEGELPSLMSVRIDRPDEQNPTDDKHESGVAEVLVLPKALEDVFAFKDQLADELGRVDGEIPIDITPNFVENRLDGLGAIKAAGVISGECFFFIYLHMTNGNFYKFYFRRVRRCRR